MNSSWTQCPFPDTDPLCIWGFPIESGAIYAIRLCCERACLLAVPCLFVTSLLGRAPKNGPASCPKLCRADVLKAIRPSRRRTPALRCKHSGEPSGCAAIAQIFQELGWAALSGGRSFTSRAGSLAAMSLSTCTEHQRAASLDNLGRVVEARETSDGAVKASPIRSHVPRESTWCCRGSLGSTHRLLRLPIRSATQPMSGPFSSLTAYCEDQGIDPHECRPGFRRPRRQHAPPSCKAVSAGSSVSPRDDCRLAITKPGVDSSSIRSPARGIASARARADFAVSDIVPGGQARARAAHASSIRSATDPTHPNR